MSFHVGQKVVCVGLALKDNPGEKNPAPYSAQIPELDKVYTIRQINHWSFATLFLLHECNNAHLLPVFGGRIEPGFNSKAFRPLIERKTDISIFKRILENPQRKIDDRTEGKPRRKSVVT